METKIVKVEKPAEMNIIIGQTHFIKTVEDIYEAMVDSVPGIKFGVGFCESSGACLVRAEGNDDELKGLAAKNALSIGAGHIFVVLIKDAYPINVLRAIKDVPEVCSIYCATANPVEVIIGETEQGRGILGVIDGAKPKGIEDGPDTKWRKDLLRKLGYKL
ncbi:MAG: adenosine monophosphate-protein transferase [Omnitrophica WOR_2 bacterium SM23_29]|nr:MAG: adenosine monophosphate-protein transferase [Omnitrophica WOR_2 bacterium SM23_29]